MQIRVLKIISKEIAWLSFVSFFILAFLDDLLPGFVSLYFPPGIFLAISVVVVAMWFGLTARHSYD